MIINICLPGNSTSRAFEKDFNDPIYVSYAWERIVHECQVLYEKEICALIGLNLLCASIRHSNKIRFITRCDRVHISSVLTFFCKYTQDFVYKESAND